MNKATFIADGETKIFYFTFPFFLKSDVVIEVNSRPATNYDLVCTMNGSNTDVPFGGGEVHFTNPPKTGSVISISRNLPIKRIVDYQETVPYSPKTHNHDMNYTFEIIKDLYVKNEEFAAKYAEFTDIELVSTAIKQISQLKSAIDNVDKEIQKLNDTGTVATIQNSLSNLDNFQNDVLDYVVASQAPTAENGFTWYRKYKSGWVEQGGTATVPSPSTAPGQSATWVTFSLPMLCTEQRSYKAFISRTNDPGYTQEVTIRTEGHSSAGMYITYFTTIMPSGELSFDWFVVGMAK